MKSPGSQRFQKTFYDEPIRSNNNPVKSTLLFTKDSGGNENSQIFLDLNTSEVKMLR